MIDRIKVKRGYGFTCPLKTMAIFASNEEFSLLPGEVPENVKLVASLCRTLQDIELLVETNALPKVEQGA